MRPRAEKLCPVEEFKEGKVVLVNYNMEEPKERGLWWVPSKVYNDLSIS